MEDDTVMARTTHVHGGYLHPFEDGRNFLYGVGETPRTLTELAMCQLSACLRAKDLWWEKHHDASVRARWISKAEGMTWHMHSRGQYFDVILSKRQIEYVIDELHLYASLRDVENACEVACADRTWYSRHLLEQRKLTSLKEHLARLPSRDGLSGMSTGSDELWFDLIDPYLYCLVHNRTHVQIEDSPSGPLAPYVLPDDDSPPGFGLSQRFSFIATPFSVSPTHESLQVKSLSYINNIHPDDRSLYGEIERLLAKCIPLFEHVLTDLHRNNPLRQRITGTYTYTQWDEPDEPEESDDEQGWAEFRQKMETWSLNRPICLPDVPREGFLHEPVSEFRVSLHGRTVKIIVRVSEIRLRPGGAVFQRTPWHVEGMRNDHIVACALYCTEMKNLVRPSVEFRMAVTAPREFRRGDVGATTRTWGLGHQSACNQHLGSVVLRTNTAVAFPNIYQHRFSGTHLEDQSRHGSMTIVGLYLVDPDLDDYPGSEHMAPTTAQVPPQQKGWMRRAVERHIYARLPYEIVDYIVNLVDGVMNEKEAQDYAREMREEQQQFWKEHDRARFCLPFDVFL